MKRAFVLGGVMAALAIGTPASAQTEFGVDASVFSSYVWRGLSLTNKPVFQPNAYLSFPLGASASLTVGGWANVDIGKYDGSDDLAEGGGTSFNFAEFDPYAEIGFGVGKATLTVGGTAYIYPNDAPGFTSDFNTVEIYGKAELDLPLAPSVAAYYDVDKIKGLYFEGSVSHGVPLGTATLNLGALAGFSAGQGVNDSDPSESANFNDDGFTHLDLSASVDFSAGPFSISPAFHFQISGDEFTKFTNANDQKDTKIWGGVTISWSKAFGGKSE